MMGKIEFLQERVEEGRSELSSCGELGLVLKTSVCGTRWNQKKDRKTI